IGTATVRLTEQGRAPVLVVGGLVRRLVRDLTHADLPGLIVLSQQEIPRDTPVDNLATIAPAGMAGQTLSDEQEMDSQPLKNVSFGLHADRNPAVPPPPHAWSRSRASSETSEQKG
ncbi:MAG: hypothetical protein RJA81_1620, partial [Planctomycetota bacterium]